MKKLATRSLMLAALGFAAMGAAASGCSSGTDAHARTGSAEVTMSVASSMAAIASVTVGVSGPGMSAVTVALAKTTTGYSGSLLDIPAGPDREFVGTAYDAAGVALFSGRASGVTIAVGQTAVVRLNLQELAPGPSFANSAPFLTGLTASALKAAPGDTIRVAVTATDADGDALTYRWSASSGALAGASTPAASWTAGAASAVTPQTVSIEVADTHGATTGASITFASVAAPEPQTGSASVTASVNSWPSVSNVLASPTRLDVGETTHLTAAASDADGDPLFYSWESTCAGAFATQSGASATFTLSSLSGSGSCAFTVAAQDARGGTGRGSLTITTAPALTPSTPGTTLPVFDRATQSATVAEPFASVDFDAEAHAGDGSGIVVGWTASVGSLTSLTGGHVSWYAPSPFAVPATITATARDAAGAVSTRSFMVAPRPYVPFTLCGAIVDTVPEATAYTVVVTERQHVIDPFTHACGPGRTMLGGGSLELPAAGPLSFRVTSSGGPGNHCAREILLTEYAMTPMGQKDIFQNRFIVLDPDSQMSSFGCP